MCVPVCVCVCVCVCTQDKLARSVTMEQGKTLADARGDVFRGLGKCVCVCVCVCPCVRACGPYAYLRTATRHTTAYYVQAADTMCVCV